MSGVSRPEDVNVTNACELISSANNAQKAALRHNSLQMEQRPGGESE
jgi:hypothetical protein